MRKYTQLSEKERETLYIMLKNNEMRKEVARILGRDRSTISREIKRNSSGGLKYISDYVQR